MKFISWNVNGLRACMNKGFMDTFRALDADFFCLQETKVQPGQIALDLPGYQQYWCYAEKKGYSGTAIFTKDTPLSVTYGVGVEELDTEGRLITLEYEEFYLVCCYTPNAQRGLARIEHRLRWEESLRAYLMQLDAEKPVIYCGDLNVAHKEIDLKNPSSNRGNAGFSDEERSAFSALLDSGFTDSFRHLYPDATGAYSWWSYMFNARQNNAGWRIDYFVVSNRLADAIHDATIHPDVMGSDHCPVGLDLNTTCNGSIWSTKHTEPTEENTTADGESPAGHIHRLIPLFLAIVVSLALLIPAISLTRKNSEPSMKQTESTTTITTTTRKLKLLATQVIDHSGTITYSTSTMSPTSSYLQQFFTNGIKTWLLTPDSPVYMVDANFYVELVFSSENFYTSQDKPQISLNNEIPYKVYYYYDENYRVTGCFVAGYLEEETTLLFNVTYQDDTSGHGITVKPMKDLSVYTTEQLLNIIDSKGDVQKTLFSSNSHSLDDLLTYDPYLQELLTRQDAIRILLDGLERISLNFEMPHYILLSHPSFQSLMTEAEATEYATIVEEWENVVQLPIAPE